MRLFGRPQIFYVSPWLLAAATGLLVLIIVTFSLTNIQREKELMTRALLQKATTLNRILHSGSKAAYFSDLRKGIWNSDPWTSYVQRVVNHVGEDPDVMLLAVVNSAGKVVVHGSPDRIGTRIELSLPSAPRDSGSSDATVTYRMVNDPEFGRMFLAVRPFFPYRPFAGTAPHGFLNGGRRRGQGNTSLMLPPLHAREALFPDREDRQRFYVVVGLDTNSYDTGLSRLRFQALALSLTMLLVGVGGWLSLIAVQGYRVSQRTLRDMKAFIALLVAKLPVGIIATGANGLLTTWNSAATDMTGIPRDEAIGRPPARVLPDDLAAFFRKAGPEDDGRGSEQELTVTVDGTKLFLLCHGITVRDNLGKYRGRVLLLSNLTELKGLEKEMRENERLAAVGRMAAGVAHEVRNPLSSIKGLALLLKNKFDRDSREEETAGLLIQEVERMNRTISELLSFARPPSLNITRVSLGRLLEENLRLIAPDAESCGIVTRLELAGDLRDIYGDRDRLNQVFINLLLNGVQAMEEGGELVVSARNTEQGSVAVTVSDSGCGIDPANMSQLFYPYFTTKSGGTGIGLAISQKIISDHGGTIRVDSVRGEGTVVSVELPVREDSAGPDPEEESQYPLPEARSLKF